MGSMPVELALAGLWGYVLGSIPTGVLVARMMRGVDVREHGSGHTGGLNVSRVAGFWGGALTVAVDALLGAAAVAGTTWLAQSPWAATVAGVMAVVGHDWSIFAGFGGGIGLSTLAGALLALDPLHALATLAAAVLLWLALVRALHVHRARSTILVMIAAGPLLRAPGAPPHAILLGVLGGAVVAVRTAPDWHREYRERGSTAKNAEGAETMES
jgi:glycerol-3-phosphate acyltransferase PlsY